MKRSGLFIIAVLLLSAACQPVSDRGTIAELRQVQIEIREEKIENGLDKAMLSYQHFLEKSPDSELTPEAIRRLADLKIEKEYGSFTEGDNPDGEAPIVEKPSMEQEGPQGFAPVADTPESWASVNIPVHNESEADFESRTTRGQLNGLAGASDARGREVNDLERAGAREALALYQKLLTEYPLYERNDQVLYQMSRAYEELGQTEEAMAVMAQLVRDFPRSSYTAEVQFRRAEYFFSHRQYLEAEDAYASIVAAEATSSFYELALYKLGWTFYKQELYEDSLHRFIALLDHKVSAGYDFTQTEDEQERKRTDDTFRVISLSFSNLGGSDSVVEYFSNQGKRSYEDSIYSNLGEFYFDKRRYADAASAYTAFISRNSFHKTAPNFHMRVIEIQAKGGFPSLVLDAKKEFARTYGLKSEYWQYFDPDDRPEVLSYLKTNLTDLANHYHACYQDPEQKEKKQKNFTEAQNWYREFLASFPMETETPSIHYQLADLLLENRSFGEAALEFEKTAYDYPSHDKSSQAGYAAVSAYREQLAAVSEEENDSVRREAVRSSLKFAETFPEHEMAPIVLGAAVDDLYSMQEYEESLAAAAKLIEAFPGADNDVIRSAWLVTGHSSYELEHYSEAETAYMSVLQLLPADDKTREEVLNNLAASIYKQGEQANARQDYQAAADHFLRVGSAAPASTIRSAAEYDAAAALIQLEDWQKAAAVLEGFRNNFPGHELQQEVTKKIAFVYRENDQLSLAATEYERIERESDDDEIRRDALLVAAELHEQDGSSAKALKVYRRYVEYFPEPVELNLENRNKISMILKEQNDLKAYLEELETIVAVDASAGKARTPRTRYLAGKAALVLAERDFDAFAAVKLINPFKVNLQRKRELMQVATQKFNRLVEYEIGELTAAAGYYLAEIYANFSKVLMASERPQGLEPMELEQYELAIEDQAYPFEEKAIAVHEENLKLMSRGVYNEWIEKSLQKLAELLPARYAREEESTGIVSSLETFIYAVDKPEPSDPEPGTTEGLEEYNPAAGPESAASAELEEAGEVKSPESFQTADSAAGGPVAEPIQPESAQTGDTVPADPEAR